MNLTVLLGEVSASPESKTLPSGDLLVSFNLRVPGDADGPRQSIPVTWIGPPTRQPKVEASKDALVIGRVARRFYRGGAQLASRVDVRAEKVLGVTPARTSRELASLVSRLESAALGG